MRYLQFHYWLCFLLLMLVNTSLSANDDFILAIDIGHLPAHPGATSARGRPEYEFNRAMAEYLLQEINGRSAFSAFIINSAGKQISIKARAVVAKKTMLIYCFHCITIRFKVTI